MNPLEAIDTLRTKLAHNTRDYRPEDHALDVLDKFFNAIGTEPAVVLVNMTRGFIAKPSPLSIAGLYGPVIGDIERANLDIAELRARLAELEQAAADPVGVLIQEIDGSPGVVWADVPAWGTRLYAAPPAPVAEIREPTPEECERIHAEMARLGRRWGTSFGRDMFDACRAVMWPKKEL